MRNESSLGAQNQHREHRPRIQTFRSGSLPNGFVSLNEEVTKERL